MASQSNLGGGDDFGGDFPGSYNKRSGEKRPFENLEDEEDDVFGSKKGKSKVEESGPGAATGMILSLRESLQNCKDDLATCQAELETTQLEIQKWHSAFQNGPATPAGTIPDPGLVVTYVQNLKSSDESLKEKLEKAKKREAAFIVTYAKREQEIADLKSAYQDLKKQLQPQLVQIRRFLIDPAIHEEFTHLKNLVEEKEKKVKELQDNVAAVNFTPSSRLGRDLMNQCRALQKQNEEIGEKTSEGMIHELGLEIAALKSQNIELRNQFDDLYDVERSNELVYILRDKLESKEYEVERMKDELERAKGLLAQKQSAQVTSNDLTNDQEVVAQETNSEVEI